MKRNEKTVGIIGELTRLYGQIQNAETFFKYDRTARLTAAKTRYKELSRIMARDHGEPVDVAELKAAAEKMRFCSGCENEFQTWKLKPAVDIWGEPVFNGLRFCPGCSEDETEAATKSVFNFKW